MPDRTTCRSDEELERFAGQVLAPEEVEDLARHLEVCELCAEKVEQFYARDTLIDAVKAQDQTDSSPSEAIKQLKSRMHALRPESSAQKRLAEPGLSGLEKGLPTSSKADLPTARYASPHIIKGGKGVPLDLSTLLAPAKGPNELGWLGPYRILRVLGRGGMGLVFEAEDSQLGRRVAVKALLPLLAEEPSARQRFLREARAAAAIEYHHIVTIHHVGEDRGIPYLAMQLLQGESLEDRLKQLGKGQPPSKEGKRPLLPLRETVRISREIAKGLAAAHSKGLIHRDIKPSNIWLEQATTVTRESNEPRGREGRVKLLDFGLARLEAEDSEVTAEGEIVGTPAYMAPEQTRPGEAIDARCDLFSLGCLLYRLSTGELPFKGKTSVATILAVTTHNPQAPHRCLPELPRSLSDLIMKMLAKEPAGRPASAQEVVQALTEIEVQLTRRPSRKSRVLGLWSQHPGWVVLAGILGLTAASLAAYFLFR